MAAYAELIAAFAAFLAAHMLPSRPRIRAGLVAALGDRPYLALYSAVSLGLLAWLVSAALRAPYVELWPYADWTPWVPVMAMPAACVLLLAGMAAPNPLSVAFRRQGFDPARPGIVAVTRHPVLWGFGLWALAHLPPNGDLAGALLFGLMAAFAFGGMAMLDRRARRRLGDAEWQRLAGATSVLLFAALLAGRARLHWTGLDGVAVVAGLLLYALLLDWHAAVIGASPWPPG